jgi:hypothetical protein
LGQPTGDRDVQGLDSFVARHDVRQQLAQDQLLVRPHRSLQRPAQLRDLFAPRAADPLGQHVGVRLPGQQLLQHLLSGAHARNVIGHAAEFDVGSFQRAHQALGYATPEQWYRPAAEFGGAPGTWTAMPPGRDRGRKPATERPAGGPILSSGEDFESDLQTGRRRG